MRTIEQGSLALVFRVVAVMFRLYAVNLLPLPMELGVYNVRCKNMKYPMKLYITLNTLAAPDVHIYGRKASLFRIVRYVDKNTP